MNVPVPRKLESGEGKGWVTPEGRFPWRGAAQGQLWPRRAELVQKSLAERSCCMWKSPASPRPALVALPGTGLTEMDTRMRVEKCPVVAPPVQDIEFTQIEMKVIEGLKIGNECLNKMHQVMSIEEVERIIGETQDAVEYQRQIDEILAGSLTEEDEDAILEELNAITQEQIELPEVPSEPLPEEVPEPSPVKNRPKAEPVAAS
ncbi:PREDICTED: charged multivesicular body protein 6 [Tinamus guttatus]|uniref:charged multivesicular body protein 6 n=1 Tax=Tinamus guttatus TaxID=94827 RepID=UPI00052ED056|nr:PREDICTED: charged multivesicular body protein 6 [Tinamus guttatus]